MSKRFIEASKMVDSAKMYESGDAIALAINTATAKFDESIELHVRLGVDPRHADQQVRGVVVLPLRSLSSLRALRLTKLRRQALTT